MRVLGIDPGLERVGYGLIDRNGSQLKPIDYGLIRTAPGPLADRLVVLHEEVTRLLAKSEPDAVAMEQLFFAKNQTTAMDVAKAFGVILLAVAQSGRDVATYSPPEIKQAVTGTGNAEKRQVQFMVTRVLGLTEPPKPDDVADALAIAVTHAFRAPRG